MDSGCTIWITGLSGAGKSSLAAPVAERLRQFGLPVVLLDGDELRAVLGEQATAPSSHGRAARLQLAMRFARLCRMLAGQGMTVVIATISLFKEVQDWNRANQPDYLEIFLDVPVEELRRRDPKSIYRRFDAGEISDVAGLDLSVDYPKEPDLHVQWREGMQTEEMVDLVLARLKPAD